MYQQKASLLCILNEFIVQLIIISINRLFGSNHLASRDKSINIYKEAKFAAINRTKYEVGPDFHNKIVKQKKKITFRTYCHNCIKGLFCLFGRASKTS